MRKAQGSPDSVTPPVRCLLVRPLRWRFILLVADTSQEPEAGEHVGTEEDGEDGEYDACGVGKGALNQHAACSTAASVHFHCINTPRSGAAVPPRSRIRSQQC